MCVLKIERKKGIFSDRFIRARWERYYLKDMYHRRVLLGADPLLGRSAYPNWCVYFNFDAFVY